MWHRRSGRVPSGFIGKGIRAEDLLDAVRTVASGNSLLSPIATSALITRFLSIPSRADSTSGIFGQLTPRELEVVTLVAMGMSNDRDRRGVGDQRCHGKNTREPGDDKT